MNEAIEKELRELNKGELKMVLCVIRFLKWLDAGGAKTKEIKRGERLYINWKNL